MYSNAAGAEKARLGTLNIVPAFIGEFLSNPIPAPCKLEILHNGFHQSSPQTNGDIS